MQIITQDKEVMVPRQAKMWLFLIYILLARLWSGMIFSPEQVHSIFIYFSVFGYMISIWHFIPVCYSGMSPFQFSIWIEIRFGTKFHSGTMQTENGLCSRLIANRVVWDMLYIHIWSGVSKNSSGWAIPFHQVNAIQTSLWNETHSRVKVILASYEQFLSTRRPSMPVFYHANCESLNIQT